MNSSFQAWFARQFPETIRVDKREKARSVIGAFIGIALTFVLSQMVAPSDFPLPWLVGPMGASAVLVFVAPASPLAQPWPVLGGNVLSAVVGVICAKLIGQPVLCAAIAVGAAIAVMFLLRCTHPPGGAMALTAALGSPMIAHQGYAFALSPVALNSLLLLAAGIAYNNLCGRRYPHVAVDHNKQHKTMDPPPSERLGITMQDLDSALRQYNEVLDISPEDLEEIFLRTEMAAYQRRVGVVTCGNIMSHDVVKVEFGTDLQTVWRLLRDHRIKAIPVVSRYNRVIGIVTEADFIRHCDLEFVDDLPSKLKRLLSRTRTMHSDKPEVAGQIMTTAVRTATASQSIASLVPLLSDRGLHHLPVVDGNERLVGIVTQSDLIGALYQSALMREINTLPIKAGHPQIAREKSPPAKVPS